MNFYVMTIADIMPDTSWHHQKCVTNLDKVSKQMGLQTITWFWQKIKWIDLSKQLSTLTSKITSV